MAVKIVTDSTSDLPSDLAEEMGITVIPALVHFGEETLKDGVDLTVEEFFERLVASEELPTTSQAPVTDFVQVYQRLAAENHSIVSIHISEKVSGTVNSATQAMQAVEGDRIKVVDSGFWSGALGLIVLEAAEAARSGKGLEEVLSIAQGAKARAGLVAMADTLEYAAKGGRIKKTQYLLGSLLQIKPILRIRDGELHPAERPRTRKKAVRRLVEMVMDIQSLERLAITHALSKEDALLLADELSPLVSDGKVFIGQIGPVVGTHTGPGALGIGYLKSEA